MHEVQNVLYHLRKKFLCLSLFFLIISSLLSGCVSIEVTSTHTESDDNLIKVPTDVTDYGPITAATYGTVALTDHGLYLIEQHGSDFVSLMYGDLATQRKVFLCANPSCEHNTEACTSYIPIQMGYAHPGIMSLNNELYFVQADQVEDTPPHIAVVSEDGLNHKQIVQLPSSWRISSPYICKDSSYFYFFAEIVDSESGNSRTSLIQASADGGGLTEIFNFNAEDSAQYSLVGAVDRQLVVVRYPIIGETEEYKYYRITPHGDISDELSETPLYVSNNHDVLAQLYPNGLLSTSVTKNGTANLCIKDLTKDEEVLIAVTAFDLGLSEINSAFMRIPAPDCYILVAYDNQSMHEFLYDKTAEEFRPYTLEKHGDYATGTPDIIGEWEDYFILCTGDKNSKFDLYSADGTLDTSDTIQITYALIPKNDFFSNNENYMLIE